MTGTVLHIDASGTLSGSTTRAATAKLVANLAPERVIRRDLAATPLPQIDGTWIASRLVPADARTDADHVSLALSDTLIAELQAADTIVIGLPVYNFGMPAALKAWVDLVARPKVTFHYTSDGPVGLLTGKRAIIATASGGTEIGGPLDFATPHLRQVLGFLGIAEIDIKHANEVEPIRMSVTGQSRAVLS
ncbi:NAD(P)H-dependent oxidoreductase [Yoonia sp. BS5-3]|uniref:FMN dependent NADH:quinone oxidoreductase n=1 Tax=Yoonia phaeophyticola TaxID=3137369 RepID=A0ABZ2V2Y8_9RHOB